MSLSTRGKAQDTWNRLLHIFVSDNSPSGQELGSTVVLICLEGTT